MTREELVQELMKYPANAKIILVEELGARELEADRINFEVMNYNEYEPTWKNNPPSYEWEYPSDYKRKTIKTEMVIVIS